MNKITWIHIFLLPTVLLCRTNFIFSFDSKPPAHTKKTFEADWEADWFDTLFHEAHPSHPPTSEDTLSLPLDDLFELPIPISYTTQPEEPRLQKKPALKPLPLIIALPATIKESTQTSTIQFKEKPYQCDQCTKYATTCKKYLDAHVKRMHSAFSTQKKRRTQEKIIALTYTSDELIEDVEILN